MPLSLKRTNQIHVLQEEEQATAAAAEAMARREARSSRKKANKARRKAADGDRHRHGENGGQRIDALKNAQRVAYEAALSGVLA